MKKIQYILITALLVLSFSCKKDLETEGVSRTTTYLTYDLTGGPLITIPMGTQFVEPGYKAVEGTNDVTSSIKVDGSVDGTSVGLYTLTYSGKNSDGFSSSVERNVIVYDPAAPATDLTGAYLSSVNRVDPARAFSGLEVSIEKLAPGFFYISDYLGGFYDQGSNYEYGPAYAMTGYFILNADNTITLVSSYVSGWGDSLNDLQNAIYNPATEAISWDAFYSESNYDFEVSLEKVIN